MALETEVKMRVTGEELEQLRLRLDQWGAETLAPRQEEKNRLFDFGDARLRRSGCTLRLRAFGSRSLLTFKGPVEHDPLLKKRPEFETEVEEPETLEHILNALGLTAAARYDKFREIRLWKMDDHAVEVCLDETPIGTFVEIEGDAPAIEEALRLLGWTERESIRRSYVELYREAGL